MPRLPRAAMVAALVALSGCGASASTASRTAHEGDPVPSSSPTGSSPTVGAGAAPAATIPAAGAASTVPAALGAATTGVTWATYGGDPQRTGVDRAAPPATTPRLAWRATVDGDVYAEPLVADGLVVVATERDTVVALDASTGAVRWSRHLAAPVSGSTLPCGDIDPSGITSTPAIDPTTSTVWVVALEATAAGPRHHLVGLDLHTGAPTSDRSVDPPGLDPAVEQQRGALLLAGGQVVVAFGGLDGDCGQYRGAVMAAPESPVSAPATAFVVPTAREGGIWSPPGPVLGPDGRVLVTTGNAASQSIYDDANAVVALTLPSLRPVDLYAPANWQQLSADDLDLSSTSPAVLANGDVVAAGKQGLAYLLHGTALGGVGHERAVATACPSGGAFGGMAVDGATVLVPCRSGLRALRVRAGTLTAAWRSPVAAPGTPLVAGGKVFDLARSGELDEIDPASGAIDARLGLPPAVTPFPALAGAGGAIFAATGSTITALTGA